MYIYRELTILVFFAKIIEIYTYVQIKLKKS